jgi:hypothetical protein
VLAIVAALTAVWTTTCADFPDISAFPGRGLVQRQVGGPAGRRGGHPDPAGTDVATVKAEVKVGV